MRAFHPIGCRSIRAMVIPSNVRTFAVLLSNAPSSDQGLLLFTKHQQCLGRSDSGALGLKRYSGALRQAVASENYYGALLIALTLPDICRRLEDPNVEPKPGYIAWFNKWMQHHYVGSSGPYRTRTVLLTGEDLYALRCSMLHQGEFNIEGQKARNVLKKFAFVRPRANIFMHRNLLNNALQLQVDTFCFEMADAADAWSNSVSEVPDIQKRVSQLGTITSPFDMKL